MASFCPQVLAFFMTLQYCICLIADTSYVPRTWYAAFSLLVDSIDFGQFTQKTEKKKKSVYDEYTCQKSNHITQRNRLQG